MVTTLRPKVKATPSSPMPTCGKAAAMTALPQPIKVNQNVPINSAAYFLKSMARLPLLQKPNRKNQSLGIKDHQNRVVKRF